MDALRSTTESRGNEYHTRGCTQIDGRNHAETRTTSEDALRSTGDPHPYLDSDRGDEYHIREDVLRSTGEPPDSRAEMSDTPEGALRSTDEPRGNENHIRRCSQIDVEPAFI